MNELDLFVAAIAMDDAQQRAAFLDQECAGRPDLRQRLDQLLAAHFRSNPVLDGPGVDQTVEPTPDGTSTASAPTTAETEGTIIAGRYKLLQQVGEGGMGTVWMADQTAPVKRRVAVKLIRTDRGTSRSILSRFEAERQAIALMDHPNIAKLFDAGTTDAGSPYFVMELVKGVPLTEFCDENRLSIQDRLKLFMQICGAVQHAHQKGIIHRDLKPTNVLVELHDDKPVPKVIDFGLAKATSGIQLSEHTLFTGFGAVAGTPLYMAPEQARLNAVDVDTRADIYALGVMLYELLTGTTPIEREQFRRAAIDEMLRLIRESEPPTPSKRLSSSESTPSVAANRHTEPAKLGRLVRGDLDWIVMKALSKERDRRYETANGFAKDLERFLSDEPVSAGPPTVRYRLRKFVARNKGQVVAALLVLLALLLGIAGTTWGMVQAWSATKAEKLAKLDADEKRKAAEDATLKEKAATALTAERLKQIELINNAVFDIFTDFDIRKVKEGPDPVEHVLAQRLIASGKKLDARAIHDPLVFANLQDRLGQTLLSLGHAPEAIEFLSSARTIRTAQLGAEHPNTLDTMNNLAQAYQDAGKLDLALPLYEETLKLRKAKLGADHPDTLGSLNDLAVGYWDAGKLDLALPLYEEAFRLTKAKFGANHLNTFTTMNNLAMGYQDAGKLDLALPLLEETLGLTKAKLGADHPDTLLSMSNLAAGYQAAGKLDLALPLLEETIKLMRVKLGADHPQTLIGMNNLAMGYRNNSRLDLALPLLEKTLKQQKAKLGADHPDTLSFMNNLAMGYRDAGKLDLALPLLEESLKLRKAKLGADHPDTLLGMSNLALGYQDAGKLDLALPLFQEAAVRLEMSRFEREHANSIIGNLADCHERLNQFDQAETWRRKWLVVVKERAGTAPLPYADGLTGLGRNLLLQAKWTDAEAVLRESLAIREQKQPEDWATFNTRSLLGSALTGLKKHTEAEPLLLTGFEGMKQREKAIPRQASSRIPEAVDRLIEFYTATNRPDEVKKWQAARAKYPEVKPDGARK